MDPSGIIVRSMYVVKRGSRGREEVKLDKIQARIRYLCRGLSGSVNATIVAIETIKNIYDGITTTELDLISAKIAEGMKLTHPDYGTLASRLLVSNLHKSTPDSFSECMELVDKTLNNLHPDVVAFIRANAPALDKIIIHANDYNYDYLGFRTLERSYLHKRKSIVDGKDVDETIDRPQYMYMRVAIQIWMRSGIEAVKACYRGLSNMLYTHATPTLFNSATKNPQMLSCFLLGTEDSIEGIMKTLTDSSIISKWAGGIGIGMSNIRPQGDYIRGTNGKSAGLVRQLKMYDAMARCWDQGGRRAGSVAIYLEPWHGDIMGFLEMRLGQGDDTERCRDLFSAIWVPDLFIRRVRKDEDWSLFSADTTPGLTDVFDGMEVCTECGKCRDGRVMTPGLASPCSHGHKWLARDMFTELYTRYEREGRAKRRVKSRQIVEAICKAQRETGMPYIVFKDHVNRKSNQVNVGVVHNSNLCVSGDTNILTSEGYVAIADISGQLVQVWNGTEWSAVRIAKTGENQEMVRVKLSNGAHIDCTPYHKFYTADMTKEARELVPGDRLIKFDLPVVQYEHPEQFPHAYTRGLKCSLSLSIQSRTTIQLDTWRVLPKFEVPMKASLADRLQWFAGYCDGCGTIVHPSQSLQITSIEVEFLDKVRLMLQTLGVESRILPDGKISRLLVSVRGMCDLAKLGFAPKSLTIDSHSPHSTTESVEVVSVEPTSRLDTYCFNEPLRHAGVFNGVLTGQCAEIVEVSTTDSYANCTLASVNVRAFYSDGKYDYQSLHDTVRQVVGNLDEIIRSNKYPVPECVSNAMEMAPIAVGIQGLADLFCMMRVPFASKEAAIVDYAIAETIYHAAVEESCDRAARLGPYPKFAGSPASDGLLQFDLWQRNLEYIGSMMSPPFSGKYDWDALKRRVMRDGLRNSLVVAYMPTVSTSQIMGNNESFEPYSSNLYTKTTLSGKFTVANNHMIRHLAELGLWNETMRVKITNANGSVMGIPEIPDAVKEVYRTVWEIPQSELMRRSAMRSAFIDQSSSLNIHLNENSNAVLRRVIMDGWALGHKTNSYYIRTRAAASALKNNITNTVPAAPRVPTPSLVAPISSVVGDPEPEVVEVCKVGCTSCSG